MSIGTLGDTPLDEATSVRSTHSLRIARESSNLC